MKEILCIAKKSDSPINVELVFQREGPIYDIRVGYVE